MTDPIHHAERILAERRKPRRKTILVPSWLIAALLTAFVISVFLAAKI